MNDDDRFRRLRQWLESLGVTYQIQCGQGVHGAIIGGRRETWAEGATDEEAFRKAVTLWWRICPAAEGETNE